MEAGAKLLDHPAHRVNRFDNGLSAGLALFSLGLGAVEMFAPRTLARAIGLKMEPSLIRALGAREIATGLGMLSKPRSANGATARVAGDVMDLAVLATAPRRRFAGSVGLATAVIAVAGVAALDLFAARRFSSRRQLQRARRIPTLDAAATVRGQRGGDDLPEPEQTSVSPH